MKNKNLLGTLELLLAAFIWGSAFVAQSAGMEHIGPLTFMSVRFTIGGVVLLPLIWFRSRSKNQKPNFKPENRKTLFIGGIVCGVVLTVAAAFQQYGLLYTTVGKAGFITTLYVIFVPLCGMFFKNFPKANIWIAVIIATLGLYLLCMTESFALSLGDTLVLMCALCYTAHILVVGHFSDKTDPIKLSCIQFLVVGISTALPAVLLESINFSDILSAWLPILYAGVLSSGVAFTLQVVAQRHTEPTIAAITMSFESVFAVLSGCVVLHQIPSSREIWGCVVMFFAIILAQIDPKILKFKKV